MTQGTSLQKAEKETTFYVNTQPQQTTEKQISYDELVKLAYPVPPTGDNILFTITYRKAHGNKNGTVEPGDSVHLNDGMIFDVTPTDKS
jgi:hypothetical protein